MQTKTKMGKALYIKNGQLVDPASKLDRKGDLLLNEGKIIAIGKPGELATKAKSLKATTVDASSLVVTPGFIDLNCHAPDPGGEQRESLASISQSAARGGFTSLACMPCTIPVNDNAFMTDFILRKAQENSIVRITPVASISAGREGKRLAEIGSMAAAGARACSDYGNAVSDSYLMRKAMEYSKAFSLPIFTYPEESTLVGQGVIDEGIQSNRLGLRGIPAAAEEIGVYRETVLARHTGAKLHLSSLTTEGAVRAVKRAKEDGLKFSAETNPQYFTLSSDVISSYDARYKCMPPLRSSNNCEALIDAIADGTIDCLATQHIPQTSSAKNVGFEQAAAGMLMLETAFSLTLKLVQQKKIKFSRLVELYVTNPSRVLGLDDSYGRIKVNSLADLAIFDLKQNYTLQEGFLGGLSRNSPFLGVKMQGRVVYTIVNGTIVFDGNKKR